VFLIIGRVLLVEPGIALSEVSRTSRNRSRFFGVVLVAAASRCPLVAAGWCIEIGDQSARREKRDARGRVDFVSRWGLTIGVVELS
jgi:hypothetical protein